MPIEILSTQYFCQAKNGLSLGDNLNDNSPVLIGNELEKVRVMIKFRVYSYLKLDNWEYVWLAPGLVKINIQSGDFTKDFSVGDSIKIVSARDANITKTGVITSMGDTFMFVNEYTNANGFYGILGGPDYIFRSDLQYDSLTYYSDLIGTSDNSDFPISYSINGITTNEQKMSGGWDYVGAFYAGTAPSGVYIEQGGLISTIAHDYYISHFFQIPKKDLADGLKHSFKIDVKRRVGENSNAISKSFENYIGSVVPFNFSYNNVPSPFYISDVVFLDANENPIEGMTKGYTKVRFSVINPIYTIVNFLNFGRIYYFTDANGITRGEITSLNQLVSNNNTITIEAEIQSTLEGTYYLAVMIDQNNVLNINDTYKTMLLISTGEMLGNVDVEGLVTMNALKFFDYNTNTAGTGFTNISAIIKDDVFFKSNFTLNLGATVKTCKGVFYAKKGDEEIRLEEQDFDFSRLNTNSEIDLELSTIENYSSAKVNFISPSTFEVSSNIKVPHQYWLQSIDLSSNLFDKDQPQKGQNRDVIRYKSLGYDLFFKLEIVASINGTDTIYNYITQVEPLKDYLEEVYTTGLTGVLAENKHYTDNDVLLPVDLSTGNQIFIANGVTKIVSRFKLSTPSLNYGCIAYAETGNGDKRDLVLLNESSRVINGSYIEFTYLVENASLFTARLYSTDTLVLPIFKAYYGTVASIPINQAQVKALPFILLASTLDLNFDTGTNNTKHIVVLPLAYVVSSCLDASSYELVDEFVIPYAYITVDGVVCKIWVYENAIPYAINENLKIKIA